MTLFKITSADIHFPSTEPHSLLIFQTIKMVLCSKYGKRRTFRGRKSKSKLTSATLIQHLGKDPRFALIDCHIIQIWIKLVEKAIEDAVDSRNDVRKKIDVLNGLIEILPDLQL